MVYKYPGVDNHFIICDVCGFKFRVKEVVKVTDKYDPHYGMIVCKKDLDVLNPVFYPHTLPKENFLTNPEFVRPEAPELTAASYAPNPDATILPGAPTNLKIQIDPLSSYLYLTWETPDVGNGNILGYIITRASPQLSYQFIINSNTGLSSPFYLDETSDYLSEYTYSVAIITTVGTGPFSDLAFWLIQTVPDDINYLLLSQNNYVLQTSDGLNIVL